MELLVASTTISLCTAGQVYNLALRILFDSLPDMLRVCEGCALEKPLGAPRSDCEPFTEKSTISKARPKSDAPIEIDTATAARPLRYEHRVTEHHKWAHGNVNCIVVWPLFR